MNRWFNKCVVHLMLALVNFPIWYQPIAILNAQPVEITEEEFTTAEELKQSNEQLILPDMTDVDKQEPIFSFEKEVLQGEVDETLLLTFFSDQTVGDISLRIPEAVMINENDLDANMAIYSRDTDQEWLLSTSKKQKQFTIPLSVDKPGSYSVVVANQAEVTLIISGEESQDENSLIKENEVEVTDGQKAETEYQNPTRSDQLRNNVGIRDFHLTSIFDISGGIANTGNIPINTTLLRFDPQNSKIYSSDGEQEISTLDLSNGGGFIVTNMGSYNGNLLELLVTVKPKGEFEAGRLSMRVVNTIDYASPNIIIDNFAGNTGELAEVVYTVREMDSKRILDNPIFHTIIPNLGTVNIGINKESFYSVLIDSTYSADTRVLDMGNNYRFEYPGVVWTDLSPTYFVVDNGSSFVFNASTRYMAIDILNWSSEVGLQVYDLEFEQSPSVGGNPGGASSRLWRGSTTEIRANPSIGYTFSRWEIVSGTGSSIASATSANTTFTMGTSNTTIRAVYTQNMYSLNVQASPAAGGNPTVGSGTVAQGATTEIRANPATGYTFSRWEIVSGTGSSIANVNAANTTFTMGSSNTTIRAVYTQNTYSVTVVPVPSDGGRPSASREVFDLTNHMIYFDAAPSEGYRFVKYELIEGSTSMWWDPYDDMPIIVFDLSDVIMHVHYEKISAAEVEVNYIDLDQNKIASSVILTGALGDNYETEPKDIEGYLLVETPENANGIFTENNQTVEYVYDTEKVTPVDPVKPEEKVDPDDKPLITENQGLLSIDFVSQFRFSEQVISVDDAIYYAHSQKLLNEDGQIREEIRPNYVQISDRRVQDDSDVGWSLSLVQKEQFQTTYGQELLGARLILSDQQLDTATNNLAPTILEEEDLELVPGVKQTLVSAQKGQGKGTWIYRFGDEDTAENSVRLVIPAKTMPKATTYTSTLVWELSMVPAVPVENR
ncbi:WxL domain-containing protein [Enterococcus sp.]|uniref:WxL domain-containing protein n=1 Tax=Enterococcus sp. TaxID=35783 RepID=UPI0028A17B2C|nr:WxL domain-containing protein [Enterococcus sp.]